MRGWEKFLRIHGWESEFESVDRVLRYYKRKTQSEGTKGNVCQTLKNFCEFVGKDPDELVGLGVAEVSESVQLYVDSLAGKDFSIRYVNSSLAFLKTFFKVNGFKEGRSLDVERHYQPARYMKRSEYIPMSAEIFDMALASGSLRNKALVLALYTSGLRNSTLRALLYRDVKDELERGLRIVKLPIYPEMKRMDAGACKGNIPYYSFMAKEATEAVRQYLAERRLKGGFIGDDEPLFASESTNVSAGVSRRTPVMKKSLGAMVKRAARKAGVKHSQDVRPHCLRKAFESALRNAGLDPKDQEFLMGHILPRTQDTYYDKTKADGLRRKYGQVSFFPERTYSDEDLRKRQVLDTVKLLGYSDDRIKRIEEALAKYEKVDEALDEIKKLDSKSNNRSGNGKVENQHSGSYSKAEVRIVRGERRLVRFLGENWDLVKELSQDRFVLKRNFD